MSGSRPGFSAKDYNALKERVRSLKQGISKAPSTHGHSEAKSGVDESCTDPSIADNSSSAFHEELNGLRQYLLTVFDKVGLKYTVDSQVESYLTQLKVIYSRETNSLSSSTESLRVANGELSSKLASMQQEYERYQRTARQQYSDRIQKLKVQHEKSIVKELKTRLAKLEKELYAKHADDIKQAVQQERARLMQEVDEAVHSKYRKKMRDTENKIEVLEKQAIGLLHQRDAKVAKYKQSLAHLESQFSVLEREYRLLEQMVQKLRHENTSLKDALTQSQTRFADQQRELDGIEKEKVQPLEKQLQAQTIEWERQLEQERQKHDTTVSTIQQRVQRILGKKDQQIVELKAQLKQAATKLAEHSSYLKKQEAHIALLAQPMPNIPSRGDKQT